MANDSLKTSLKGRSSLRILSSSSELRELFNSLLLETKEEILFDDKLKLKRREEKLELDLDEQEWKDSGLWYDEFKLCSFST